MANSTHLNLPFILPAQAGKHITHNEALAALDTLTQLAILDRDLSAPPASPDIGDRYIVATGATDTWSDNEGQVATWDGAAWLFFAPQPGWLAYLLDEAGLVVWTGSAWASTVGMAVRCPCSASPPRPMVAIAWRSPRIPCCSHMVQTAFR